MELNLVQTPVAGPVRAAKHHNPPRRRFKQHRGHQHRNGGGGGGGGWKGGARASEVVGPMPTAAAAAGRKQQGGGGGSGARRPERREQQRCAGAVAGTGMVKQRPPLPFAHAGGSGPKWAQQAQPATLAGRKRARTDEDLKEVVKGAGAVERKRSKEEEEEDEDAPVESASEEEEEEEQQEEQEEEDGMEVEEEGSKMEASDDDDGDAGSGEEDEEEDEAPAPPPAKARPTAAAAAAAGPAANGSSGDNKPSRKNPLPASTAALDRYHLKPSELDRTVQGKAGAAPVADGGKEAGGGGGGASLKSSKHIFTATPFAALGLHERLVNLLSTPREHHGFGLKVATKVQSAAIPALLKGDNALLCSETGSGKTLAYLLPLLQQLQALQPRPTRGEGTYALIVAPTRELSHQIHDVLTKLVRAFIWVVPGIVSGGEKRKSEKARLRKGVTVLVGTPGRLLDHLQNTQAFEHGRARWLVLDEVDRLVDLGFEAQVREIVGRLRGGGGQQPLQVLAATATLAGAIDRFGRELLGDHVRIDAKTGTVRTMAAGAAAPAGGGEVEGKAEAAAEAFTTPVQLVQQYMLVTCKLRLPALAAFLRVHAGSHKTVVFFSTCDAVDFHHALFRGCAWPGENATAAAAGSADGSGDDEASGPPKGLLLGPALPVHRLHGSIPQAERLQTFRAFGEARQGVLLCTDVAARGLDLPAVDWIVQYDPPTETAEYVHRVGRTARRGRKGRALLFLLPSEKGYLDVLQRKGIAAPSPLSLQQTLFKATPRRFLGRFRAPEEVFCLELQQRMEWAVAADKELLARGRKAFGSFVRAYATHPAELKPIFTVRALHLGHVAKSFALSEPPTALKVGKEIVKIPGAGKPKEEKGAAAGGGASSKSSSKSHNENKKKKPTTSSSSSTTGADFSLPRSVQKKPRKTNSAFNSMSEFSAG